MWNDFLKVTSQTAEPSLKPKWPYSVTRGWAKFNDKVILVDLTRSVSNAPINKYIFFLLSLICVPLT